MALCVQPGNGKGGADYRLLLHRIDNELVIPPISHVQDLLEGRHRKTIEVYPQRDMQRLLSQTLELPYAVVFHVVEFDNSNHSDYDSYSWVKVSEYSYKPNSPRRVSLSYLDSEIVTVALGKYFIHRSH